MSQTDRELAECIRDIANPEWRTKFPMYSGKVVAGTFDAEQRTVSVERSVDSSGYAMEGVLTNVFLARHDGVLLEPADGADCLVAEVDNGNTYVMLLATKYNKVVVQADTTVTVKQGEAELTLQSGKLKFVNGSGDLKTGIDNLMTHLLALTVSTAMGPSGPPINAADLTNDKNYFNNLLF